MRVPRLYRCVIQRREVHGMRFRAAKWLLVQIAFALVPVALVAVFVGLRGAERHAEAVTLETGNLQGTACWSGLPLGYSADGRAAQAQSGETAPVVVATWELPDMQPGAPGFHYWAGSQPTDLNDNGILDADDDPLTPGMQVHPNLCDQPAPRNVEYWLVAEAPNGIADISAAVIGVSDPNGNFDYQVDLTPVGCNAIGLWNDQVVPPDVQIGAPLNAAIDTSRITREAAVALVKRCYSRQAVVYEGTKALSNREMAGTYTVVGYAGNRQASIGALTNHFTDIPVTGLSVGSSVVDWETSLTRLSGNEALTSPDRPTVEDCGNVDTAISLRYTKMVHAADAHETIDRFGATLMGETLQFVPDVEQTFGNCLSPSSLKPLDLSIYPTGELLPGVYTGTLGIYGETCPTSRSAVSSPPLAQWERELLDTIPEMPNAGGPPAVPTPTPTPGPASTVAPTVLPVPENTPPPDDASTRTPVPTDTPTIPTDTAVPTDTPIIPTDTAVPTDTPIIPTDTAVPTDTPTIPTDTAVPTDTPIIPTDTAVPTDTPIIPTDTAVPTDTPTIPTDTAVPTDTPTIPTDTAVPADDPIIPADTTVPA